MLREDDGSRLTHWPPVATRADATHTGTPAEAPPQLGRAMEGGGGIAPPNSPPWHPSNGSRRSDPGRSCPLLGDYRKTAPAAEFRGPEIQAALGRSEPLVNRSLNLLPAAESTRTPPGPTGVAGRVTARRRKPAELQNTGLKKKKKRKKRQKKKKNPNPSAAPEPKISAAIRIINGSPASGRVPSGWQPTAPWRAWPWGAARCHRGKGTPPTPPQSPPPGGGGLLVAAVTFAVIPKARLI